MKSESGNLKLEGKTTPIGPKFLRASFSFEEPEDVLQVTTRLDSGGCHPHQDPAKSLKCRSMLKEPPREDQEAA